MKLFEYTHRGVAKPSVSVVNNAARREAPSLRAAA